MGISGPCLCDQCIAAVRRTRALRQGTAAFEKAIALDPALVAPRVYMANLLTDTGRVEQSVPLLREAIQNSPNNAEAHWELGYAYRLGGMRPSVVLESDFARTL